VYDLAARVKERGIDLSQAMGPWRAEARLSRPGRVITNDRTEIAVDSSERAADVAGLLNWCGVHDLNPVPDLVPRASASREATPEQVPHSSTE
jgi:hypothetical protein